MQENPAPPQENLGYYLGVPGSGHTSLHATAPAESLDRGAQEGIFTDNSEEQNCGPQPDDAAAPNGVQPMGVFSPSLFARMVRRVFLLLSTP